MTNSASSEAGGVFGYGIYNDAGGTITNLINTGTISGTEYDVGSWKTNSHIVNFFWYSNVVKENNIIGI